MSRIDGPKKKSEKPRPYFEQGLRIKDRRLELGLEAASIAKSIGVTPVTMWRYEEGQRSPARETMRQLASLLGKPPVYFTDGLDDMPTRSLPRGELLRLVEDRYALSEPQKQQLRHILTKYQHHPMDAVFLEILVEVLKRAEAGHDDQAFDAAVAGQRDKRARRSGAKKLPNVDRPKLLKRR